MATAASSVHPSLQRVQSARRVRVEGAGCECGVRLGRAGRGAPTHGGHLRHRGCEPQQPTPHENAAESKSVAHRKCADAIRATSLVSQAAWSGGHEGGDAAPPLVSTANGGSTEGSHWAVSVFRGAAGMRRMSCSSFSEIV